MSYKGFSKKIKRRQDIDKFLLAHAEMMLDTLMIAIGMHELDWVVHEFQHPDPERQEVGLLIAISPDEFNENEEIQQLIDALKQKMTQ